ncbi:MAG: response regulator [Rubrivivax sp.]
MPVKVLIVEGQPGGARLPPRGARELRRHDRRSPRPATRRLRAARSIWPAAPGLHGTDPFKLLLVDLELPDGNGLELLAELAQYPATKIVTTLYPTTTTCFRRCNGADGYLLKETASRCRSRSCRRRARPVAAVAGDRAPAAQPFPRRQQHRWGRGRHRLGIGRRLAQQRRCRWSGRLTTSA